MRRAPLLALCLLGPVASAQSPARFDVDDLSRLADLTAPALSPDGNRVAYVVSTANLQADASQGDLWVVGYDGRGRTRLTSTPEHSESRPQWSPDGKRLFVAGLLPEGRLGESFHALAYNIDATTGSTKLLSDIVMFEPLQLTFSPDGTRGVYADAVANDMTLVDFRNGATTALPRGHAPVWSPNGKRIAYTGEVYETGAEFRYYEPLCVMNADGTNLRRLTVSRVANHAYTAAQWSKDNVHVLANRQTFTDDSLTRSNFALRIVNADTRALVQLAAGYVEAGGWFEP